MNIEQKMLDKLAGDMAKEMDYDIIVDMLEYVRVELPPFDSCYHAVDIKDWCNDNCTGKFRNYGVRFAFEKAQDAEWFILRWK
jgi:hypothetical protein